MSGNDIINHVKPINLTDDELRMYSDYCESDARIVRNVIWAHVEKNEPIPNELKPILLELLVAPYKGLTKQPKASKWKMIIKEIAYLRNGTLLDDYPDVCEPLTKDEAVKLVADKHTLVFETVEREYRKPKYKILKNTINELG